MKRGPQPFVTKVCPSCGIDKPRSEYYKKQGNVSYNCKPCTLEYNRKRVHRYLGKYRENQNKWRSKRYKSDAQYREKIAQQKKAAYDKRKDAINERRRERWLNDPNNPARLYFRSKYVKRCTPKWISARTLLDIYYRCPRGMEVDHIIPLKGLVDGRPVSGLHVPWNLQYLTVSQNRKKHNRISESDITHRSQAIMSV